MRSVAVVAGTVVLLASTACIPYTVGSTAQTMPKGFVSSANTAYFIPNALKGPDDTIAVPLAGIDHEWRMGLDERSDFGARVTSGAAAVLSYKHRFRDADEHGPALAYLVGTGLVNAGQHAHFEATLVASGNERSDVTPYGGVRAMQVVPIALGAAHDSPTLGVFGGVQLGDGEFAIRPELGVF